MSKGQWLVVIGFCLVAIGFAVQMGWLNWLKVLGKLPGDIRIEQNGTHFYFPITTCLIISIVISLIMYFIRKITGHAG